MRNFHANLSSRRLSGHYPGSNDPNNQDNQESNTITSSDLGLGSSFGGVGGINNVGSLVGMVEGGAVSVAGAGGAAGGVGMGIGRRKETISSRTSGTTESSDFVKHNSNEGNADLDADGKIKAYVDFSHFHHEWNKRDKTQSEHLQQSSYKQQPPQVSSHNGL